jgi:hypothetical protein
MTTSGIDGRVASVSPQAFSESRSNSSEVARLANTAEYQADLVVELLDGVLVGAVVLEVQRAIDERKRLSWPS